MEGYTEIGHTKKTRGVGGELKVDIKDPFVEAFMQAEVIFLELQGGPVPFFVEQIRQAGDLLVKLDEIDTPEEAVALTGKPIYMPDEELDGGAVTGGLDLSILEGFSIIDEALGPVGRIEEVLELPQQMVAVVTYQDREVLIPLTDELITGVDPEARTLHMSLPEGLLEL
jgi:16S rRNA processing protein RimM